MSALFNLFKKKDSFLVPLNDFLSKLGINPITEQDQITVSSSTLFLDISIKRKDETVAYNVVKQISEEGDLLEFDNSKLTDIQVVELAHKLFTLGEPKMKIAYRLGITTRRLANILKAQ